MALATLSIDLEARLARLESDLERASRINARAASAMERQWQGVAAQARAFGATLAAVATGAGLQALADRTLGVFDAMKDAAEATGATVERISALQDIAARAGTDFGVVESALIRFNAELTKDLDDTKGAGAVLKRIGLQADELRRIDPAEALQRVAKALAQFAEDGGKARAIYLLFGKSAKDVAPFLNDFAEAGELNATATRAQAEEVDKFNRSLRELRVNFDNLLRGLAGDIVPAINTFIDRLGAARTALGGLAAFWKTGFVEVLKGNVFSDGAEGLKFYNDKLKDVDASIRAIESGSQRSTGLFGSDRLENLRKQREELARQAALYRDMLNAGTAGGGRGAAPQVARPNIGAILEQEVKTTRQKLKSLPPVVIPFEVQSLSPSGLPHSQIDALERVQRLLQGADINRGAALNEEIEALNRLIAAGVPDAAAYGEVLQRLLRERAELNAQAMGPVLPAGMAAELAELQALAGNTESARRDRLLAQLDGLNRLIAEGADVSGRFAEAAVSIRKELAGVDEQVKETAKEVDRFAQEFERNVQSALGDTLVDIAKGNFGDIADAWGNMLLRMAAEAASADIMRGLFGDSAGGGGAANFFGSLIGAFTGGGASAGATGGSGISFSGSLGAGGSWGDVMALQSAGAPRALGASAASSTTVYQVAAGVQRNELLQALQAVEQRQAATLNKRLAAAGI